MDMVAVVTLAAVNVTFNFLKSLQFYNCLVYLFLASGMDQHQLPMCLRGTSEEQVHLASLFNTLIHHKKCRRTRTVFTGNF